MIITRGFVANWIPLSLMLMVIGKGSWGQEIKATYTRNEFTIPIITGDLENKEDSATVSFSPGKPLSGGKQLEKLPTLLPGDWVQVEIAEKDQIGVFVWQQKVKYDEVVGQKSCGFLNLENCPVTDTRHNTCYDKKVARITDSAFNISLSLISDPPSDEGIKLLLAKSRHANGRLFQNKKMLDRFYVVAPAHIAISGFAADKKPEGRFGDCKKGDIEKETHAEYFDPTKEKENIKAATRYLTRDATAFNLKVTIWRIP